MEGAERLRVEDGPRRRVDDLDLLFADRAVLVHGVERDLVHWPSVRLRSKLIDVLVYQVEAMRPVLAEF